MKEIVIILLFVFCEACTRNFQEQKCNCDSILVEAEKKYNEREYAALFAMKFAHQDCDTGTWISILAFKGLSLLAQNKYNESIVYFDSLIAIDPDEFRYYAKRGFALELLGKSKEAKDDYSRALLRNPSDILSLTNRGEISRKQGDFQAALNDFEAVLRIDSTTIEAYNNLGLLLSDQNRNDEAVKIYRKALSIDSADFVLYNMSMSLFKIGMYEDALFALNKAIERNPRSPNYYFNRGYIYLKLNQRDKACADFEITDKLGGIVEEERRLYCK